MSSLSPLLTGMMVDLRLSRSGRSLTVGSAPGEHQAYGKNLCGGTEKADPRSTTRICGIVQIIGWLLIAMQLEEDSPMPSALAAPQPGQDRRTAMTSYTRHPSYLQKVGPV